MLEIKKEITLTGESKIDGVVAENYRAVIDSANPSNMTIITTQRDKELRKANRDICRVDEKDFEETAYALQDQMISELFNV